MKKKLDLSNTKYKVKKGDTVEVIAGENSGKRGEVLSIDRGAGRVFVKDINIIKKTMPKSQENQKGGIVEREASIHISSISRGIIPMKARWLFPLAPCSTRRRS